MDNNIEVRKVEYEDEIIALAPLIRKFFKETTPVYTEDEFYKTLFNDLKTKEGILAFANEDGKPIAYVYAVHMRDFTGDAIAVVQGYSSKPFTMRKLRDIIDEWTLSWNTKKQIFLVPPKLQHYYEMQFGCKLQLLYMTRIVESAEVQTTEVEENVIAESAST